MIGAFFMLGEIRAIFMPILRGGASDGKQNQGYHH